MTTTTDTQTTGCDIAPTVAELAAQFQLHEANQQWAEQFASSADFVLALHERGRNIDAIKMLAGVMPIRLGVWWTALTVFRWHGESMSRDEWLAVRAGVAWVIHPEEENRRRADVASKLAGHSCAAGCLAAAAFMSGGSISKPSFPMVPAPEGVSQRLLAGSLLLAAVKNGDGKSLDRQHEIVELGLQVARGECPWPTSEAESARPVDEIDRDGMNFEPSSDTTTNNTVAWDLPQYIAAATEWSSASQATSTVEHHAVTCLCGGSHDYESATFDTSSPVSI